MVWGAGHEKFGKKVYDQRDIRWQKLAGRSYMMSIRRRYMVLASLMLIGLVDIGFAQPDPILSMDENRELMNPDQPEGMMFHQMEGLPMGVPIEVLQSGRGFALKDNESHVLRLNVETLRPMDPRRSERCWPPIRA